MVIEPPILPLTGETLPAGSNFSDCARLDVSGRNLWYPLDKEKKVAERRLRLARSPPPVRRICKPVQRYGTGTDY